MVFLVHIYQLHNRVLSLLDLVLVRMVEVVVSTRTFVLRLLLHLALDFERTLLAAYLNIAIFNHLLHEDKVLHALCLTPSDKSLPKHAFYDMHAGVVHYLISVLQLICCISPRVKPVFHA